MKSCLLLLGSTAPKINFDSIQIGETKGSVLYKLGNPTRTYFKEGTQRWVYRTSGENGIAEKELWFQEGRVVLIDSPPQIIFTPVD
ncbi:hypothetical protein K2X05_01475 [bacterium]|nr:hypothetical protein [bacterium]